jgi:hypothetical protein
LKYRVNSSRNWSRALESRVLTAVAVRLRIAEVSLIVWPSTSRRKKTTLNRGCNLCRQFSRICRSSFAQYSDSGFAAQALLDPDRLNTIVLRKLKIVLRSDPFRHYVRICPSTLRIYNKLLSVVWCLCGAHFHATTPCHGHPPFTFSPTSFRIRVRDALCLRPERTGEEDGEKSVKLFVQTLRRGAEGIPPLLEAPWFHSLGPVPSLADLRHSFATGMNAAVLAA